MAGFFRGPSKIVTPSHFRGPSKIVIPSHYIEVDLGAVNTETMVKIIDWILASDVISRGVIQKYNNVVNGGQDLLGNLGKSAQIMLWELYRSSFQSLINDSMELLRDYNPRYMAHFWFAEVSDAVEFKLIFSDVLA